MPLVNNEMSECIDDVPGEITFINNGQNYNITLNCEKEISESLDAYFFRVSYIDIDLPASNLLFANSSEIKIACY